MAKDIRVFSLRSLSGSLESHYRKNRYIAVFMKIDNEPVRKQNMATTIKEDADAQVTFEDQQKINKFARTNNKLQDLKEEHEKKKKELQNLEDAGDDLLMLDDGEMIPYQIGEVFISMNSEETGEMLEKAKESTQIEIGNLENLIDEHKKILQALKVELYAKFGNSINLEAEEE